MNILGVLSLELFGDCRASFRKLLLGIATNPLILGSVVGVVFIVCGIKLPESVEVSVSNISKTSSTLLLFLLGASIEFGSLARYCRELVLVSVMRLLLLPAICLYITYKLGYAGIEFASILAVIATPNAANSYNMAVQMGGDGELASSIIVITTVASLFTIVGWTYVFRTLGLF